MLPCEILPHPRKYKNLRTLKKVFILHLIKIFHINSRDPKCMSQSPNFPHHIHQVNGLDWKLKLSNIENPSVSFMKQVPAWRIFKDKARPTSRAITSLGPWSFSFKKFFYWLQNVDILSKKGFKSILYNSFSWTTITPTRFVSAADLETIVTKISELQLLLKNSSL